MSLKYIQDGVPMHIAGGGNGDSGLSLTWDQYKELPDKTGIYYVTGAEVPDGDLSGSVVTTEGEGEVPTLPTITATQPTKIQKVENLSSFVSKVTEVITNVRWLIAHIGDIRKVTGGSVVEGGETKTYPQVGLTITDGIANLNNNLTPKSFSVPISDAISGATITNLSFAVGRIRFLNISISNLTLAKDTWTKIAVLNQGDIPMATAYGIGIINRTSVPFEVQLAANSGNVEIRCQSMALNNGTVKLSLIYFV